jgi:maleate isomerase
MPTLKPILDAPFHHGAPVTSCMHALAWRSIAAATGQAPDRESLLRFVRGEGWRARYAARMG